MRIQYASDLHLEFQENWRVLRENGPMDVAGDILVLAGDTGYLGDEMYSTHPFWNWASENFEQVLVALGNHEFYKYYDLETMQDGIVGEIRPNVHYYYNKVMELTKGKTSQGVKDYTGAEIITKGSKCTATALRNLE